MKIDRALLAQSWRAWISSDNRARVGPPWLPWLWTVLFSIGLAVPFTVLGFFAFARGAGAWRNFDGWVYWYGKNLIVCLSIAVVIHLLFDLARALFATPERIGRWTDLQRTAFFGGVPLLGVAIGWPLGVQLAGGDVLVWISSRDGNNIIAGTVLMALTITFLSHNFFAAKARQFRAEQRATEAQLRLLQGQIEPHFLFNTLANVSALMEHDVPRARRMLESFTDYLRGALGGLRHGDATLGSELDLVRDYLVLLQMRMDDRLRFGIDCDAALRGARMPPLLLQPLVENAIRHGLEGKVDGGHVQVHVRRDGDALVVDVADDGLGLDAPPRRRGAGMALANLRERLQARYGAGASLTLRAATPGTVATLRLPLQTGPAR